VKMKMLSLLVIVVFASPAFADCLIWGDNVGTSTDDPSLGAWRYELTVSWENSQHGMSHIDLIIDDGLNCSAADLATGLAFPAIGGSGMGEDDCPLQYDGFLSPNGDPSLGLTQPMIKFEPQEYEGCEGGATGTAVLVFYSDYPPYPVADHNLALVEKYSQYMCVGNLTGVFPALPCSPVAAETETWSSLKAQYKF
jgi:hypothetical protein